MESLEKIEKELINSRFYPNDAFIWEKNKSVYEFPFIEKLSNEKYYVHIQRHYASDPFTRAEYNFWTYYSLTDAVKKLNDLK